MVPQRLAAATTALLLTSCGGGTIANEDIPGPAIAVIVLIVIVAFLYIAYIGGKDR